MLDLYARVAARLRPFAWVGWAGLPLGTAGFGAAILGVEGEAGQLLGLAAITLLLWSLTLIAFLSAFTSPLPEPSAETRLWRRLAARLQRLYRWFLALVVTTLMGLALWFSVRALVLMTQA
jgi:hypothetical protein